MTIYQPEVEDLTIHFTCVVALSSIYAVLSIFNEFPQEIVELCACKGGPGKQQASLLMGGRVGQVCLVGGLLTLKGSRRKSP